jgi:tetratricopeptide (TPR) repeat protein
MAVLGIAAPTAGHTSLRRAVARARELEDPQPFFLAAAYGLRFLLALRDREMASLLADEFLRRPREGARSVNLGLCLRFVGDLMLERGDRAGAEQVWHDLEQLAERTRDATLAVLTMAPHVLLAVVEGHLDDAVAAHEAQQTRAEELGVGATTPGSNFFWVRAMLYLGRGSEALTRYEGASRPIEAARAMCLAHLGRHQEASAIRDRFGDVGSDQDESSMQILTALLEAAILGEDKGTAQGLARRMAPLAPYPCAKGLGVSYVRLLGGAAALHGDRAQAKAYYQQALEVCAAIGFRPEIALTHLELAELLLTEAESLQQSAIKSRRRGRPKAGEPTAESLRSEAQGHLDFAIEELRAMKMQPALERALSHKGLLHA